MAANMTTAPGGSQSCNAIGHPSTSTELYCLVTRGRCVWVTCPAVHHTH